MSSIKIKQWPKPIEAGRCSILESALRQGIPMPHECRAGECGTCKLRLLSGEVSLDPYQPEALSDSERADGLILACRAHASTDLRLDWIGDFDPLDAYPVQTGEATVQKIEYVTPDVTRIQLALEGFPLAFRAGQYARLGFDGCPPRAYSMANLPDESLLEFHIRHLPQGVTSGYVRQRLAVGEQVRLEGPLGSAHLRTNHAGPILAIAGGAGLAPMISIVRSALAQLSPRPIHLYFGVRDTCDLYYQDVLSQLEDANPELRVHRVLSAPSGSTPYRSGFVHEAVADDLADLSDMKIYLAGPPVMVDATTEMLRARGAIPDNIHSNPFVSTPPKEEVKSVGWLGTMSKLLHIRAPG